MRKTLLTSYVKHKNTKEAYIGGLKSIEKIWALQQYLPDKGLYLKKSPFTQSVLNAVHHRIQQRKLPD